MPPLSALSAPGIFDLVRINWWCASALNCTALFLISLALHHRLTGLNVKSNLALFSCWLVGLESEQISSN